MRASSIIHRRGHTNAAARGSEEKKEDCDDHASLLLDVERGEEKDRRRGATRSITRTLVRLAYRVSSPSFLVEHKKEFLLGAAFILALFVCYSFSAASISSLLILGGRHRSFPVLEGLKVQFPVSGSKGLVLPGPFVATKSEFQTVDYGALQFELLESGNGYVREIEYTGNEKMWEKFTPTVDTRLEKYYYAYDDDVNRNPIRGWGKDNQDHLEKTHHCRMTAMHREITPNCNVIHEIDFHGFANEDKGYYLGGGAFRDVFALETENGDPDLVLKTASYGTRYGASKFEYYRMDSAVMSALSPHPLVVDIYSSCSLACKCREISSYVGVKFCLLRRRISLFSLTASGC